MISLLAASADGSFPDPLPVNELFEFPAFLFEDSTWFAMNRTGMLYLFAAFLTILFVMMAFGSPKVVPGKFQAAMEAVVDFIKNNIVGEVIGPKGYKFVPFLFTLFVFIFINNLFEILPFVNFPSTGRMALPAFLALTVWTFWILVGFKAQGPWNFFKNSLIPGDGIPWPILLLVVPIELVSTFIVRPLTHAVRLFANMMAGHILLSVVFLASNAFFLTFTSYNPFDVSFNLIGSPIGLIAMVGSIALVAFELLVGFLQAYIFTILTAVYIGGSLESEH